MDLNHYCTVLETDRLAVILHLHMGYALRIELRLGEPQSPVLPLNYAHHIILILCLTHVYHVFWLNDYEVSSRILYVRL